MQSTQPRPCGAKFGSISLKGQLRGNRPGAREGRRRTDSQIKLLKASIPSAHVAIIAGADHHIFLSNEGDVLRGSIPLLAVSISKCVRKEQRQNF